ncbi:gamma-tubulin complex component 6 [Huso huso]|uniref:Gamma-tubulin complex component 6 n=1 Tax=Huso huso TaxID=61971 RepID=A0ABR0ZBY4_HUSHU
MSCMLRSVSGSPAGGLCEAELTRSWEKTLHVLPSTSDTFSLDQVPGREASLTETDTFSLDQTDTFSLDQVLGREAGEDLCVRFTETDTFSLDQVQGGGCEDVCTQEGGCEDLCVVFTETDTFFSLDQPVLDSSYKKGLVFQAFTGGVRRYLHYYRACVLSTPPTLSLLTIVFLFRKLGRQLRYLSELCWCGGGTGAQGLNRGAAASFPMGVKLLSYLYNEAQNNCSNENYPVLLSLLKSSCEPYTRFIYDWVYSGVFRDVYGEFMIQVNEDYLSFRDKHFWTQGYLLISKDVEDCVPVFLRHIANEIYVSGKTINLLRVCCPRHYICWSELPVPARHVTFSLQELEEIERTWSVQGHGEDRPYSAIKREEKALRTELARQELIVQVRETTAKALETIRGRQVSQRLAQEAKKRERFQELKQQLEVEQERRSAARQQEADSDFGFTRELRDRERRLQALEEQLESQARRELIEHYSRLSEEAAAREWRALWKVQRHRLETERNSFLQRQQSHIQAMLEKFPLGERREQLDIIPKGDSPRRLPAGGRGDSGEQGAQEILKPQSSDPSIPREHPPALEAEPQESEKPTPDSVQQAPGDPLAHPTGPPKLGEQEPQARLESPGPLDIHDFLPKETPDLPAGTCPVVSAVDAALLDIGSELPEGASGLQQEYDFSAPYSPLQGARLRPRWNTHQHTSQANIQLGQYASDMEPSTPRASVHGHVSEANIKVGQNVSEVQVAKPVVNVHGHSSESNIQLGQYASDVEPSKPRASVHGHVSEATIQLGDESKPTVHSETLQAITEVSEGDPDPGNSEQVLELHDQAPGVQLGEYAHVAELPGSTASVPGQASEENLNIMEKASEKELILPHVHIQGHASEEHIKLGGYMSDTEPSKPRVDIHGHASEGSIKVGEDVLDVDQVQPHLSIHGHASDSSIKVGGYVSDSKQTSSHCSVHGHASDSSIKVGGYMSDSEQTSSHCSVHGHASDSSIKVGGYVSDSKQTSSHCSVHGHASDSSIKVGGYMSDSEQTSPHCSVHGHASDSSIKVGGYVSDSEQTSPHCSVHGHASDSSIKVGGYMSDSEQTSSHCSVHGHASDSSIKVGGYVSDSKQTSPHCSVHGHASDSSIKVGEYTADEEPSRPRWSSHGHASQSHFRLGKLLSNVEPFKPCSSDALSSIPEENTEPGTGPGAENETSEWARRGEQGALAQSEEAAVLQRGLTAEQMEASVESLLCQGPPWGEGEGWGPEWPREQAYLHSLAAQYQVEQYQDSYNLMTAAPDSHLLHQVTAGPYAFPVDPSLRRATDTTAVQLSEMVSLPVLMKHSVTAPLLTHVFLVNKAIVDYYFMELNVERHCEALRHFLLMEDGEFAQSLSDLLFEKLGSGQTPGELLNPLVLNSILNKSLQYSLHGDSQLAANLTFALRFLPESFHPHAPDALACLELRYKVDWPLNIVITDSCMNKYNRIFSFLLQLKHMVWTLRDVWFHLKRAALVKGAGSSVQFRQLQLYRHEMQHFVKVIQGYIANQILHVTWSEFRTKLGSAANLDDIHRTHADYLNRAIFRGLLTEKAAPVMNIIHSIFSLILKFRAQLISQPWSSQQGAAEHPSFGVMQQSYRTFKYYSHFLFKVVTKLVNRGYQPHLEDFLLRINFNSYYQDS